jgi:integrase
MSGSTTTLVPSRGGPSVELAVSVWLDAKARRSESERTATAYRETIAAFRQALGRAATDEWHPGGLDLDAAPQAIALVAQAWAFRRADGSETVAAATANQRLAILSSFYRFAGRRQLLTTPDGAPIANPIDQLERATVHPYGGARALSAETISDQLATIDRSTLRGSRDYALLTLALSTGRRASELRGLTRGDVLLDRSTATPGNGARVTVLWRRTKGGKSMQDTLAEGTAAALLAWLTAFYGERLGTLPLDAPIFVSLSRRNYGRRLGRQGLANVYQARLGTSKVHTTRHTFARQMEDAGAKVSEIQRRLGHASIATTGRYLAELASAENPYAATLEERFGVRTSTTSSDQGDQTK